MNTTSLATIVALTLLAGSCGSGGGSPLGESTEPAGRVEFLITDAPFNQSLVQSALVEISDIQMHVDADAESGFVDAHDGPPMIFDLMRLRNGLTRRVESGSLPAGDYRQVRLVITAASLTLDDGREFSTLDGTLDMPSSASSGLKFFLDPPASLEEGGLGRILLDFDLNKSFKPLPANDPAKAKRFQFSPTVRAVTSPMNSLQGVVIAMNDQGFIEPVELAVVYLMPTDETDLDKSIASTATEADGSMAILGIPEGTYDLIVVTGDTQTTVEDVFVAAAGPTEIDIVLE